MSAGIGTALSTFGKIMLGEVARADERKEREVARQDEQKWKSFYMKYLGGQEDRANRRATIENEISQQQLSDMKELDEIEKKITEMRGMHPDVWKAMKEDEQHEMLKETHQAELRSSVIRNRLYQAETQKMKQPPIPQPGKVFESMTGMSDSTFLSTIPEGKKHLGFAAIQNPELLNDVDYTTMVWGKDTAQSVDASIKAYKAFKDTLPTAFGEIDESKITPDDALQLAELRANVAQATGRKFDDTPVAGGAGMPGVGVGKGGMGAVDPSLSFMPEEARKYVIMENLDKGGTPQSRNIAGEEAPSEDAWMGNKKYAAFFLTPDQSLVGTRSPAGIKKYSDVPGMVMLDPSAVDISRVGQKYPLMQPDIHQKFLQGGNLPVPDRNWMGNYVTQDQSLSDYLPTSGGLNLGVFLQNPGGI